MRLDRHDHALRRLVEADFEAFAIDGYLVVPEVVPEPLLRRVDDEIATLDAAAPSEGATGPQFTFLEPERLPAADAALRDSGALALAEQLVAPHRLDLAFDHIQIACTTPPYVPGPRAPHVDGHRSGEPVESFTLLAAVFLGDEQSPDRGNLLVWPGSHLTHEALFRERGAEALVDVGGHAVLLDPPVFPGPSRPVLAGRGDLLLAHYLLGHNTGPNTSDDVRRIAYYRLACAGHRARWTDTFVDAFKEFEPVRPRRRPQGRR